MNMNIMKIMQLKNLWSLFIENHPRFPQFISAISKENVLSEGTVIEVDITTSNGQHITTNLKLTASDLELFEKAKEIIADLK